MRDFLRWTAPLAAAAAFLVLDRAPGRADPPPPDGAIEVLFAPTGKDRRIEAAIMDELDRAKKTVDIAIFQFTSTALSDKVASVRKRARVRILFDGEQARDMNRRDAPCRRLPGLKGIEAKFVELPGSGQEAPKFHHKFCVIDGATVITGSYNWTVLGDEANHENLLIIRDAATAQKYAAQFEAVWADAGLAKPVEKPGEGK